MENLDQYVLDKIYKFVYIPMYNDVMEELKHYKLKLFREHLKDYIMNDKMVYNKIEKHNIYTDEFIDYHLNFCIKNDRNIISPQTTYNNILITHIKRLHFYSFYNHSLQNINIDIF